MISYLYSFKKKKKPEFNDIVNILSSICYIVHNISRYRITDIVAFMNILVTNMYMFERRKRNEKKRKKNQIVQCSDFV
jgi:hypothetical protein